MNTRPERSWRLAVDFGTTNTAAAYRVGRDRPQPVRLSEQTDQMPSAVLVAEGGIVVGTAAVRGARLDPTAFEPCPKRRLGEGEILLGDAEFAVVDLVAAVLHQVLTKAMRVAGGGLPTEVVLTYPQQWAAGRQELLIAAAERAGFTRGTVRLLPEPVAAASWYASSAFGEAEPVPPGKYVAVFDFGGGTLDVAVLQADDNGRGGFRVVAADGIDPLGGEILDLRMQEWLLEQLREGGHRELVTELTSPEHLGALHTVREQLRHAKHELSEYESARIPVVVGDRQTVITITAGEFDRLVSADIDAGVELTRRTLADARVPVQALHALYLTGGSSHLRLVHRRLTDLLGKSPATLSDPKLVVALGALIVAGGRPVDTGRAAVAGPAVNLQRPATTPAPGTPRPLAAPRSGPTRSGPTPSGPAPSGPTASGPAPRGAAPSPVATPPSGTAPAETAVPGTPAPAAPAGGRRQMSTGSIIGLMAATAAVIATVLILVLPRKDNTGRAAQIDPATSSAQTPTTSPSPGENSGSSTPVTTPVATICWDDSSPDDGCPELTGRAALEWVFPWRAGAGVRECVEDIPPYADAVEYYSCTYSDLPHTTVYLARWTDPAIGFMEIDAVMDRATGAIVRDYDNGDAEASAAVDGLVWTGTDTDRDEKRFSFIYDHEPFSLEVVVTDASVYGEEELDVWDQEAAQFRYAAGIAARGSLT